MKSVFRALWNDEYGVVLSAELVIIGSVLSLGVLTGMVSLQSAVNEEMTELGGALRSLDQSYSFSGISRKKAQFCGDDCGCGAVTYGSSFQDTSEVIIQESIAGHSTLNVQGCVQLAGCPCGDYGGYVDRTLAGCVGQMKITEYPLCPVQPTPCVIVEAEAVTTVLTEQKYEALFEGQEDVPSDYDEENGPQEYWATHRAEAGAPFSPKYGTFSNEGLRSSGGPAGRFQPKVIVMPGSGNMNPGCYGMCPTPVLPQHPCGSCGPCLYY